MYPVLLPSAYCFITILYRILSSLQPFETSFDDQAIIVSCLESYAVLKAACIFLVLRTTDRGYHTYLFN